MLSEPWTIQLLGKLSARQGERTVERFRTYKTGVLLAYLAFYPERPHPREVVIELLWPECEPALGRNSLSQSLSSLRHQLEPPGVAPGTVVIADRASIRLNSRAFSTDAAKFLEAVSRALRADSPALSAPLLAAALEHYQGELLPGYYEDWNLRERDRLGQIYLDTLDRLVCYWEQSGEWERAIEYARRALSADPLREETHTALIRLYTASGQRAAALRQYQLLSREMRDLGLEPKDTSRGLLEKLNVQQAPSPSSSETAVPPAASPPLESLPAGTVTLLVVDSAGGGRGVLPETAPRHGGAAAAAGNGREAAAFGRGSDALSCAIALRQAARRQEEPSAARMALHTGEVGGKTRKSVRAAMHALVERASRLLIAANPGQTLCSEETAVLLRRDLEAGTSVIDLGVFRLAGREEGERVYAIEEARASAPIPRPRAEPVAAGRLPVPLSRFFGREEEIDGLRAILEADAPILVTLTGPGGTGKTRLSLEVVRRIQETARRKVWFISLAATADPALLPNAIREQMQIPVSPAQDPLEQVIDVLTRAPTVLVLDNFEQLVPVNSMSGQESVNIVRHLIEHATGVRYLITSRRRLGIAGEMEYAVSPLPVPRAAESSPEEGAGRRLSGAVDLQSLLGYASVRLFIDRAQAVRPDFQLTRGNADSVARLCGQLEGIPLALELAASRSQVLTPAQILSRINQRLDFLSDRRSQPEERHQTLRAAVDWSFRLLPETLQTFFARLTVFRGGWSLEAAEAVCEEPLSLDYLAELRECSLALSAETALGEIRFRLLETLRDYGFEKLTPEQLGRLERLHAEYFVGLAEKAQGHLGGPEQREWLDRLEADHDNFRAALDWCAREGEVNLGLKMGGSLWRFWDVRGHLKEARRRLDQFLWMAREGEVTAVTARALHASATLAASQGDYASAIELHLRSLAAHRELGDERGTAYALNNLGIAVWYQGDYSGARERFEESLAIKQKLGDERGVAYTLSNIGAVVRDMGDFDGARALHEQSLDLLRPLEDRRGIALSLEHVGQMAMLQGRYEEARSILSESLALQRELENKVGVAAALVNLGATLIRLGDYGAAREHLLESLAVRRELELKGGVAYVLEGFAELAACEEQWARAAVLTGAAARIREEIRSPLSPAERVEHERLMASTYDALSGPELEEACRRGSSLSLEQAVDYAREGR